MSYSDQFPESYWPSNSELSAIEGRGFEDVSYKNDMCPSWVFESDWISLALFIMPEDLADREETFDRFTLYLVDSDQFCAESVLVSTESLSELISVLDGETRIDVSLDWGGLEIDLRNLLFSLSVSSDEFETEETISRFMGEGRIFVRYLLNQARDRGLAKNRGEDWWITPKGNSFLWRDACVSCARDNVLSQATDGGLCVHCKDRK